MQKFFRFCEAGNPSLYKDIVLDNAGLLDKYNFNTSRIVGEPVWRSPSEMVFVEKDA